MSKTAKFYRYGPHVVQVVKTTDDGGTVHETLSVSKYGSGAAARRGGTKYARLPKRWRQKIQVEVLNRGQ